MSRITRLAAASAALALIVGGLAGCTAPAAKPVVLRIVTDDDAVKPAGKQILHFAAEVKRLSHGSVTVVPKWHAAGTVSDWDQANANLVMSGQDALGLIPSRAWDELGVQSLRALSTPFLLTTEAQVKAAVDGAEAKPMLAGLATAKVTGLGLWPEALRHPFGVGTPLLKPADFHGLIRTPTSVTAKALITALGGTSSDAEITKANRGGESEYLLAPSGTIATGNVVLFPKVNVLVANAKVYAGLSDDQRKAMQSAAAATRQWANAGLSDSAAATAYCKQGGRVAEASAADVASLTAAAAPVRAMLESDPGTKRIIEGLTAEVGPAAEITIPAACAAGGSGSSAGLAAMTGTWVVPSTAAAMKQHGATDEGFINENAGTMVITFTGSSYSWIEIPQKGYTPSNPSGQGDVTEQNGAVTIFWSHASGENTTVTPHRDADGTLSFGDVTSAAGAEPSAHALDLAQFASGPVMPLAKAVQGTWTTTVAASDLAAVGAADAKVAGKATLKLGGGRWSLARPGGSSSGSYTLKEQQIVLRWPTGGTTTATIGPNVEGGLTFEDPTDAGSRPAADKGWDQAAFAKAWTKP